jgi:hypothetical protein
MRGILAIERTQAEDTAGRILNAQQFATDICGGHVSAKYVIKHFRDVGSKPGKEWLWYENVARSAWAKKMQSRRVA